MSINENFNTTNREKRRLKKSGNNTVNKAVALNPPVNPFDAPLPTIEKTNQTQPVTIDGLGYMPIPKRQGRDITLYLSNDVLEAIANAANHRGVSKSKIANHVLKRVLLLEYSRGQGEN